MVMELLTLRILLAHLYEEADKPVFAKPLKNKQSGFPSVPDMKNRHLLLKCDELGRIHESIRGGAQMNILDQKSVNYRVSIQEKIKEDSGYFDDYLKACQNWLLKEEYNANALYSRLIPWLKRYIPDEILLPVTPFFKLYEAVSSLLQPELPRQAHAEAMMWLMLYAALGNDFRDLPLEPSFFSILAQDLSLFRSEEIDKVSTFLIKPENRGRIAVLFAGGGIGKTYLASQILQVLQQKGFSYQYYSNTKELNEDVDFLCRNSDESKNIIFIDDVPFGFEEEPVFKRLSFRNYRILVTTRWKPQNNSTHLVLFPVFPFSAERLSRYFLSKIDASVSQKRKNEMYSLVIEIAKKIACNTDLFLSLSQLMCRHIFEPEGLLEKLNLCQTQNILVKRRPLCEHVYQLFFSHDFANISDQQVQYLYRMAFLPKSGISYGQLQFLMKDIDPNDMIRKELLEYGFLKATPFNESEWCTYANSQPIFCIHDNMRQAAVLSFAGLINKPEYSEKLYIFLENLEEGLRTCKHMCNTTPEEDQKRYLNLLFWQRIAQFLIEESTFHLLKLLPNKELVSQLFCTVSDLFYFGSIYDDAVIALNRAQEIGKCGNESFQKRKWQIASVTGKKGVYNTNCEEGNLGLWECLREEEMWLSSCQEKKRKHVLNSLGFANLRIDEVSLCAKALREKADELAQNGWMILRIREGENAVRLYSLQSQHIQMRRIVLDLDENSIIQLFQNTYILPKTSWKTTPQEMLREGLRRRRYDGWGIFQKSDGKLLSYVDVKVLRPDEPGYAQIGFAATDVFARSRRLTQFLMNHICLEYPTRGTFFTTHEQNGSMRRVASELGYRECENVEYNRIIKNMATLRYEKKPLVKMNCE